MDRKTRDLDKHGRVIHECEVSFALGHATVRYSVSMTGAVPVVDIHGVRTLTGIEMLPTISPRRLDVIRKDCLKQYTVHELEAA